VSEHTPVETAETGNSSTLLGLAGTDADLLEEICGEALGTAGVDGRRFFDRLRQGQSLGVALGLPPDIIELIYTRAHRWFVAGRADRAEPLFRALCAADGGTADYWIGLGICLRLKGDYAGASLAFSVASNLRPDWAVPAFHAAELALQRRDRTSAEAEIRRFRQFSDAATPERMQEEISRMEQALSAQTRAAG
jgi:tetratricopeptide (TPR) repeat protein